MEKFKDVLSDALKPFHQWRDTQDPKEREGISHIVHYYGSFFTKGMSSTDFDTESHFIRYAKCLQLGKKGYGVPTLKGMREQSDLYVAKYIEKHGIEEAGDLLTRKRPGQLLEETYPRAVRFIDQLAQKANELILEIAELMEKQEGYDKKMKEWQKIMNTLYVYLELHPGSLNPMFQGEDVKALPVPTNDTGE